MSGIVYFVSGDTQYTDTIIKHYIISKSVDVMRVFHGSRIIQIVDNRDELGLKFTRKYGNNREHNILLKLNKTIGIYTKCACDGIQCTFIQFKTEYNMINKLIRLFSILLGSYCCNRYFLLLCSTGGARSNRPFPLSFYVRFMVVLFFRVLLLSRSQCILCNSFFYTC